MDAGIPWAPLLALSEPHDPTAGRGRRPVGIEAILLGAAAHVNVAGEWDNDLMEQIAKPRPIATP